MKKIETADLNGFGVRKVLKKPRKGGKIFFFTNIEV